jgi:hypothetical protein
MIKVPLVPEMLASGISLKATGRQRLMWIKRPALIDAPVNATKTKKSTRPWLRKTRKERVQAAADTCG